MFTAVEEGGAGWSRPVWAIGRGKSELRRADRQVTPGRREATDRATENIPPVSGKGEKVG